MLATCVPPWATAKRRSWFSGQLDQQQRDQQRQLVRYPHRARGLRGQPRRLPAREPPHDDAERDRGRRSYGGLPGRHIGRDGNNNLTLSCYDGFYRLQRTIHPGSPGTCAAPGGATDYDGYLYDAVGNPTTRRTRAGALVTSIYDALNRLSTQAVPANAYAPANTYGWGYDLTGRVLQVGQSIDAAPLQYGYDTAGRLTSEQRPDGKAVAYTLDPTGNRTGLRWPESGAQAYQVTYAYDPLNRVSAIHEGAGTAGPRLAQFGYDTLSQRTSLAYANGASVAYAYWPNGLVQSVRHGFAGGASVAFTYLYNSENGLRARLVSDAAY